MANSIQSHPQKVQERASKKVEKTSTDATEAVNEAPIKKPFLPPPQLLNPFTAFFLLDKLSIESEAFSYSVDKEELVTNTKRWEEAQKKKVEQHKETMKKEESAKNWSVAMKLFSWMSSFLALMTGVVLIATGAGAIAGGLLIAGGSIQIINQIMNETDAWKKIMNSLPGDDTAKKGNVVTWMQIGIMVLSLILCGAATVFGSLSAVKEGMQSAFNLFIAGIAFCKGITSLGSNLSQGSYLTHMGDVKIHEGRMGKLKGQRGDLTERTKESIERLKTIYDSLALNLEMRDDIENIYNQRFSH